MYGSLLRSLILSLDCIMSLVHQSNVSRSHRTDAVVDLGGTFRISGLRNISIDLALALSLAIRYWRGISEEESTCCSCRGLEFSSLYPCMATDACQ